MSNPIHVLLVEDNHGDTRLTREALRDSKLQLRLHEVSDGDAALRFLRRQRPYARAPRPDLIILDLNLPGKDGRQALAEIKADSALRSIPVVILTSSPAEEDIVRAYELQANCYVQKPLDFEQFAKVVRDIEGFWFTVVKLPGAS